MGKEVNVLRVSMVCLVLVAVLLLLAVVALGVGSAGYSLQQIIQALFYDESGPVRVVVYNLRLPRLIMAVEVGACLAVAGALLQAVMRNPLADPGIIASLQVRLLRQRRFYCCFRLWFHQCRFLLLAVRLWPVYLFICWPGAMGLILSE